MIYSSRLLSLCLFTLLISTHNISFCSINNNYEAVLFFRRFLYIYDSTSNASTYLDKLLTVVPSGMLDIKDYNSIDITQAFSNYSLVIIDKSMTFVWGAYNNAWKELWRSANEGNTSVVVTGDAFYERVA